VLFITHSLDEAILLADRVLVMSARPGRIIADIKVPFARPRDPSVRSTAEFAKLEGELRELLRNEVNSHLASLEAK
ncbi:MAG: ABC transporter ATP-binding protein, partial [Actinomycetota bacterium]